MVSIYIFWILLSLILYCYIGYPLLLLISATTRRLIHAKHFSAETYELPDITIVIAAYNERSFVNQKIQNILSLNYSQHKIKQIWVTDGSTDGTPELLASYPNIKVLHFAERLGKAMAINHAMEHVETPITVFSDANTLLTTNALIELVKPFQNHNVGCVAGEKQILIQQNSAASSTGEGIYWKYESFIKKLESETGSTLSAAGELYAIRTALFKKIPADTILDDFEVSTQIALSGFTVKYADKAIASEYGSLNFDEEQKRKIRIASGGFQTLFNKTELLNPFLKPTLTFKYLSHKVLRWLIVPFAILLLPIINIFIALSVDNKIYILTLLVSVIIYGMAFAGIFLKNFRISNHIFFLPYYFISTQISEYKGLLRYITNRHNHKWEKAKRET